MCMDDSSMFIQWAMDTLQHDHQPGAAVYTVGSGGRYNTPAGVVEKDGWSSSSVNCPPSCSVDSTNDWNFTSALAQPSISDVTPSPTAAPSRSEDGRGGVPELAYASRKASEKSRSAANTGRTSPEPYVHGHVMAERKRREKISRRFIELSSVIPGLKRIDKATILSEAVRYVKEQQEKIKALEEDRNTARSIATVVHVHLKKPCIAAPDGGGCPSPSSSAAAGGTTKATTRSDDVLPEIEARISESNVMARIHCGDGKGVIVSLLSQIEGLHLSITHTNVVPFLPCTVIITIMAKRNLTGLSENSFLTEPSLTGQVNEGFNSTAEDIVGKLGSALHPRRC